VILINSAPSDCGQPSNTGYSTLSNSRQKVKLSPCKNIHVCVLDCSKFNRKCKKLISFELTDLKYINGNDQASLQKNHFINNDIYKQTCVYQTFYTYHQARGKKAQFFRDYLKKIQIRI